MSVANQLADEVVTVLNAATLSKSFTAAKRLFPRYEFEDMDALTVEVYVGPEQWSNEVRSTAIWSKTYDITVFVQDPVGQSQTLTDLNTSVAADMSLVEEIKDALTGVALVVGSDRYHLSEISQEEPYSFQFLHELGMFFAGITLRYV